MVSSNSPNSSSPWVTPAFLDSFSAFSGFASSGSSPGNSFAFPFFYFEGVASSFSSGRGPFPSSGAKSWSSCFFSFWILAICFCLASSFIFSAPDCSSTCSAASAWANDFVAACLESASEFSSSSICSFLASPTRFLPETSLTFSIFSNFCGASAFSYASDFLVWSGFSSLSSVSV